jgi:hypothetical protein
MAVVLGVAVLVSLALLIWWGGRTPDTQGKAGDSVNAYMGASETSGGAQP